MKNANKKSNNSKFWLKIYIKKRGVILLEQEINRWRLNGLDGKEKKSKDQFGILLIRLSYLFNNVKS